MGDDVKKTKVTKGEYEKRMDRFREIYGHVWNAPKWARDEIRSLQIYDPDYVKPEQPTLSSFEEKTQLDPRLCNTGVTSDIYSDARWK